GQPPAPPIVVAQIQAPAPEVEAQFGEAIWVKVYTTELEHEVGLEALIGGNQVINQAEQNVETEWQLLQVDPGNPLSGQLESGYGAPVGPNAASIIRRYEFYKFSGNYNPEDHQAMFDAGFGDSHPGPNDIGTYLGAQNAGINLNGQLVAAVPEPETYALMLAGLGLIGFFARRIKASVVSPNLS
ncbi:MAG: PEP-CTERM sorting domain-containing protein, partial [Methylophilaceae bacterium]